MSAKNIDDLIAIETDILNENRNNMYNTLLKDRESKKHLCKILKVEESILENVLMLNGKTPPDDFDNTD